MNYWKTSLKSIPQSIKVCFRNCKWVFKIPINESTQYLEKEKNSIISAKKKFRLLQRNVMDKIEPQTLKFRCDAFNVGVAQVCVQISRISPHDFFFFFFFFFFLQKFREINLGLTKSFVFTKYFSNFRFLVFFTLCNFELLMAVKSSYLEDFYFMANFYHSKSFIGFFIYLNQKLKDCSWLNRT